MLFRVAETVNRRDVDHSLFVCCIDQEYLTRKVCGREKSRGIGMTKVARNSLLAVVWCVASSDVGSGESS